MRSWPRVACLGLVLGGLFALAGTPAEAAKWSRAYINSLPDDAFASVEVRPDGTSVRHLPHHDAQGRLDLPHLRSAMSRLHQVQWVDPANADRARQHLVDHFRELGLPVPGDVRASGRPKARPHTHHFQARGTRRSARIMQAVPSPR